MEYFREFDDVARNYIILLLKGIAAGTITFADDFNDYENGVYLNDCQFSICDINLDGVLELILRTGNCEANFYYTVYTIIDGELIDCGGIRGSHAALYTNGSGGFLRYAGHMGVYDITVSTLEGATLITQEIANGTADFSKGEDYPELEEYGYGDYDQYIDFIGIPTLFLSPAG